MWWIQYLAVSVPLWFLVKHSAFAPARDVVDVIEAADLTAAPPSRQAVHVARPPRELHQGAGAPVCVETSGVRVMSYCAWCHLYVRVQSNTLLVSSSG